MTTWPKSGILIGSWKYIMSSELGLGTHKPLLPFIKCSSIEGAVFQLSFMFFYYGYYGCPYMEVSFMVVFTMFTMRAFSFINFYYDYYTCPNMEVDDSSAVVFPLYSRCIPSQYLWFQSQFFCWCWLIFCFFFFFKGDFLSLLSFLRFFRLRCVPFINL